MHILFLSDNFPPETNAPASRVFEHSKSWVRCGHQVTVITCAPNFPEGKIYAGYENKWYQVERLVGIRVVRVKTYITANEGVVKRSLDYLSFMISAFGAALFEKEADVIIGTSPQFFTAIAAWAVAALKGKPFIFEVRDLWPESILAVGAMRRGMIIRILEGVEKFLYRNAKKIITVTEAFKEVILKKGIESEKIEVVYNGVNTDQFSPREKDVYLAQQHGLLSKFVVGYIGTFGMAHALETVLDAAFRLKDHPEISFLFVGGGAEKKKLIEKSRVLGLTNVIFLPFQPKETMPKIWSLCDIALVHLKNSPLFQTVVPSKLFEAMGMGLPILLAAPAGEAADIVERCKAGIVVEPENSDLLAAAIMKLLNACEYRIHLARASAQSADLFNRERLAEQMLNILMQAKRRNHT